MPEKDFGSRIGIFGLGPGSIEPTSKFQDAQLFVKERQGLPEQRSVFTATKGFESLFARHVPEDMRTPMDSLRLVTVRGTDFTIPLSNNGYCMIDYPALVMEWEKRIANSGKPVHILPKDLTDDDIKIIEHDEQAVIQIQGQRYEFQAVVDATGISASLSTKVEPKRKNEEYISEFLCFGTFKGNIPEGQLIISMGPAGGTSWATPSVYKGKNGECLVDVVFTGWGYKSFFERFRSGDGRERLDLLTRHLGGLPNIQIDKTPQNITYGMIRNQPIPRPESSCVFPVGEAVGVAQPLSSSSFNRSLRSGELLVEALSLDESPSDYHKRIQDEWRGSEALLLSSAMVRAHGQRKNPIGRHIDTFGRWINEGKLDDKLIRAAEELLIDGKASPKLILKLANNPLLLLDIIKTAVVYTGIRTFGVEKMMRPEWSFPDIDNPSYK